MERPGQSAVRLPFDPVVDHARRCQLLASMDESLEDAGLVRIEWGLGQGSATLAAPVTSRRNRR